MAHELYLRPDGNHSMFFAGQAPWHRLGVRLDEPPNAAEAIKAAGLDYEILSMPLVGVMEGHAPVPVPGQRLNVRSDTMAPLGLVSDRYRIVQNRTAFDFLDSVVATGDLRYETAGSLGKGERIWMLAKVPGEIQVGGVDAVEKYLLLFNSHDGTTALRCLWTPIRVVCANTVRAALDAGEGQGITIRHDGDLTAKIAEARNALGLATAYFEAFGEGAELLVSRRATRQLVETYFNELYPDPTKGDPARAKTTRMSLHGLFEQGMGQDEPGIRGTWWAAYNAVTELVDHHTGNDPTRRMVSSWYGDGARDKARAWELAIAAAETAPTVFSGGTAALMLN